MISEQITRQEFDALIGAVWTSDAADTGSKRARAIRANRAAELHRLMRTPGANDNIRGTRWAAYQSVTEYLDHTAPVAAGTGQANARAERPAVLDRGGGQGPNVRPAHRVTSGGPGGCTLPARPLHPFRTAAQQE